MFRQLVEKWPTTAEKANATPTTRAAAPTQSQVDHVERQRCPRSDCHAIQSSPSASTAKSTASWVRVAAAAAETSSAGTIVLQPGLTSARAMRKSASVASG